MEPTIKDGAAVVVDRRRNNPLDGKIYIVRLQDRLWVKRIQWTPNGGLRLISDNQIYSSFDISRMDLENEDMEVIGQIIHTSYDLPD